MPKYLDYHGLETLKGDLENIYVKKAQKGVANGVASLNANGKIPASQIPDTVGVEIDDTAGSGVTDKTWSANKLTGEFAGKADLDGNGKVPSSQLPSYVDDVVEYASLSAFPETGESGKIYVALDNNKTYRWSGSEYIEITNPISIDDTAGAGVTDRVWSANKTNTLAPNANPVFTGSVSLGRKNQGDRMRGSNSTVLGNSSVASGSNSNALGDGLIAMGPCSHVIGEYNIPDAEEWVSGKLYHVNDIMVRYVRASGIITSILYFKCNTEHTSSSNQASDSAYWDNIDAYNLKYAEIVGNGYAEIDDQTFILTEHRSNARALDWDGNEYLAGDLFVRCNNDSTGGAKVATTDIIDDTAGNGDTDKVWSADKSYDELNLKIDKSTKGQSLGVASLNVNGKIPYEQISPTIYKFTEPISANSTAYTTIEMFQGIAWSGSPAFTNNVRVVGWHATNAKYLKNLNIEIGERSFSGDVEVRPGSPSGTLEIYVSDTVPSAI